MNKLSDYSALLPARVSITRLRCCLRRFVVCVCVALLCSSISASAQKPVWRYVATVGDGSKAYLNDDRETLANQHVAIWGKAQFPDDSIIVSLMEFDCQNSRRLLTRQATLYNSRQVLIETVKLTEWKPIIPGSLAARFFESACVAQPARQIAQVTLQPAYLRAAPDQRADVLRVAAAGEQFEVAAGTGQGGWFNLVDARTQEDYWLPNSDFEIIKPAAAKPEAINKRAAPRTKSAPPMVRKRKV